MLLKLTDGQFENAKINPPHGWRTGVKNAKLWNPDFVGMAVFIMVLFSIVICHIMAYIGSWQQIGQFEYVANVFVICTGY